MSKPSDPDLTDIGWSIIKQVKSVFVFGSGNRDDDAIKTGGWSKTIQMTSRAAHTYLLNSASKKWTLQQEGDYRNMTSDDVALHANMTGLAMAARIGNCHENAALALYFCLQRKDINGDPIFSKVSIVLYGFHVFVKAETKTGNILYIDPWESKCYRPQDFRSKQAGLIMWGSREDRLQTLLQVFANERDIPSKVTVQSIDKEDYLDKCELAIEKHLRALNVHPKDMDHYLGNYNRFKQYYKKHRAPFIYVDKKQFAAKLRVLRELKRPRLPKDPTKKG